MTRRRLLGTALIALALVSVTLAGPGAARSGRGPAAPPAAAGPALDSCTSLLVGRLASADGSTMTSHSCDSGTDRTWMTIVPHSTWSPGARVKVWIDPKRTKGPDDPDRVDSGEIPQVPETYAYLNAAYPIMNEKQLAIGETTIGGREELVSAAGMIDAPELYRLVLERAKTAREAIRVVDELTSQYGYNDWGECFTFADPQEAWHFEIFGPGRGKVGAVWAALRIPDGEVGVSANASRIRRIDLGDPDRALASANAVSLAESLGFWSKDSGRPFEFCYAYAPESRTSLYCRRREWRALSLLAPGLKLDPESENYPFSVTPERKVTVADLLAIFRDVYEGTPYDMTRGFTSVDRKGQVGPSPVVSPFLGPEWRELLRIRRERTICSPAATYLQITQSRAWLPDLVGGVVWLGYDNPATTPHLPVYVGSGRLPASYAVDGRWGFRRDCAWWAFRNVSKLAQLRWRDMAADIAAVWKPLEQQAFARQPQVEAQALALYRTDPRKAAALLGGFSVGMAEKAVADYWKLADDLMGKYAGLI